MSGQLSGAPAAGHFTITFHHVGLSNSGIPEYMGKLRDRQGPAAAVADAPEADTFHLMMALSEGGTRDHA